MRTLLGCSDSSCTPETNLLCGKGTGWTRCDRCESAATEDFGILLRPQDRSFLIDPLQEENRVHF